MKRCISLLIAATALAAPAGAAVADFETQPAFRCDLFLSPLSDGGLTFEYGFSVCFYSPASPADFPTPPSSTVAGFGASDVTVTKTGGGVFDLISVDLAFGPFDHDGLSSDTTTVTGVLSGGGTVSSVLTIDYGFDTYTFNWTGLTSVVFGELEATSEYLAFDNLVYDGGAVPAPAALALFGFGVLGLASVRQSDCRFL